MGYMEHSNSHPTTTQSGTNRLMPTDFGSAGAGGRGRPERFRFLGGTQVRDTNR
jgi:hypothetical protein